MTRKRKMLMRFVCADNYYLIVLLQENPEKWIDSIMEEKKKRAVRTTKVQVEGIVNFLQQHPILLDPTSSNNPQCGVLWPNLAEVINGLGGPQKNVGGWKAVINDLKTNIKRKGRAIYVYQQGTGGGPPPKPFTDIEEKLYNLVTKISVEGHPDIPEVGIHSKSESQNRWVQDKEFLEEENVEIIFVEEEGQVVKQESDQIRSGTSTFTPKCKKKKPRPSRPSRMGQRSMEAVLQAQVEATKELASSINILAKSLEMLAKNLERRSTD